MSSPSILQFLNAGYPTLYLPTSEYNVAEARVMRALSNGGYDPDNHDLMIWRVTTGCLVGKFNHKKPGDFYKHSDKGPKNLDAALTNFTDFVNEQIHLADQNDTQVKKGRTLVIHNPRKFIDNHVIIQSIIDAAEVARKASSFIILIGPELTLPSELRSIVTYCDCPLPSRNDIIKLTTKLVNQYKSDLDLPKDKSEIDNLISSAATAAMGLDLLCSENAILLSLSVTANVEIFFER